MSKVFSKITMALLLAVSCFLVTGCGESTAPSVEAPAADMEKADMGSDAKKEADMGSDAKEEAASGSEAKTEGSGSH